MNARQKAKHYKKLYENRPISVIRQTLPLEHLRVCQGVSKEMMAAFVARPEFFTTQVENEVLSKMGKAIKDRIIVEEDIPRNMYVYSLDVWVEKR